MAPDFSPRPGQLRETRSQQANIAPHWNAGTGIMNRPETEENRRRREMTAWTRYGNFWQRGSLNVCEWHPGHFGPRDGGSGGPAGGRCRGSRGRVGIGRGDRLTSQQGEDGVPMTSGDTCETRRCTGQPPSTSFLKTPQLQVAASAEPAENAVGVIVMENHLI